MADIDNTARSPPMRISRIQRITAALVVTTVLGSTAVSFAKDDSPSDAITALPTTDDSVPVIAGEQPEVTLTEAPETSDDPSAESPSADPDDPTPTADSADEPTSDETASPSKSSDSATGSTTAPVSGTRPTTSPVSQPEPTKSPAPQPTTSPKPSPTPTPAPSPTPTQRTLLDFLTGK